MDKKVIPYVPGEIPPRGYMLGRDAETGAMFWVHPGDVELNQKEISVLTDEQTKRLRRCYEILKEPDRRPWETWVHNFSCDQTPERELLAWEAFADAYLEELRLRGKTTPEVRRLLYIALLAGLNGAMSTQNVLSISPQCKSLSKLGRALRNLKTAWSKYETRYFLLPPPRPPETCP